MSVPFKLPLPETNTQVITAQRKISLLSKMNRITTRLNTHKTLVISGVMSLISLIVDLKSKKLKTHHQHSMNTMMISQISTNNYMHSRLLF